MPMEFLPLATSYGFLSNSLQTMATLTIYDTVRALKSIGLQIPQNILLQIALWTYLPNETIATYIECISQILVTQIKQTYDIVLPLDIIQMVIHCLFSVDRKQLKWGKCNNEESDRLLEFSDHSALVRYRDPTTTNHRSRPQRVAHSDLPSLATTNATEEEEQWDSLAAMLRRVIAMEDKAEQAITASTLVGGRDYVIVRSAHCLPMEQRVVINCYVKSRGDEMWIGVMTESGYAHNRSLRANPHAITYMHSGSMHVFGTIQGGWFAADSADIEQYESGDWLMFDICLSTEPESCVFNVYKNGELQRECGKVAGFMKPKQGSVAVDEHFGRAGWSVLEEDGVVWDATLNQTDISQNNNKFYKLQVVKEDSSEQYCAFFRWGRVGNRGQSSTVIGNKENCIAAFRKKFYTKTNNHWENRDEFELHTRKYAYLPMDYSVSNVNNDSQQDGVDEDAAALQRFVFVLEVDYTDDSVFVEETFPCLQKMSV